MTSLRARWTWLPLIALVPACGGARESSSSDASVGGSAATPAAMAPRPPASARPPLDQLRAIPAIANHLDPQVHLARVASGYRFDGYLPSPAAGRAGGRFTEIGLERLVSTVPARSTDPVHVGVLGDGGGERLWFEVVADDVLGVAPREPEIRAGALAFRDVVPGEDAVHLVEPGRVEELRIVRAPADEIVTRHRLRAGKGVKDVRVSGAIVQVLDDAGRIAVQSEPILAYDAAGAPMPARVAVARTREGWTLETRVATKGRAFPITVDPTWTLTLPDIPNAHNPAWAFPFTNGKVLYAGGTKVDVFDPYAMSSPWGTAMTVAAPGLNGNCANGMTVTQLLDGKLLYAANTAYSCLGSGSGDNVISILFDPVANAAQQVGNLPNNHASPQMVTLADGRVVLFGQALGGANPNGAIEVYTPGTKTWATAVVTPFSSGSGRFTMTQLNPIGAQTAGSVLIAGGGPYSSNTGTACYLFDPNANTFTATGSLHAARSWATAQKLADGTVLIFGGQANGTQSTAEIYDPVAGSFSVVAASMTYARRSPGVVAMPDGRWFIVGGYGTVAGGTSWGYLSSTEFYDPVAKTFTAGPTMNGMHEYPAVAPLPGGRVIVANGWADNGNVEPAEIYTPDPIPATSGSSCPSGYAADGYCCDQACTGTCVACDVPGHVGVCTPVTGVPVAGHGSCAPFLCAGLSTTTGTGACATTCGSDAGCSAGNYCDTSTSQCVPQKAQAAGCGRNGECASGYCVDGVCCGSACNTKVCQACNLAGSVGTCSDVQSGDPVGTHGTCGVYACVAGACASGTCTSDAQCASHDYCVSGACTTSLGQGSLCTRDAQCQSGHCVDGYCCDSACAGDCQACDVGGNLGKCTSVASGPPHGTRSCAPYASCSAGACATSCATDVDCTTGNGCSASVCIVRKANGAACAANTDCASGSCADGVCCDKACSGACQACNLTGSIGTCTAVDGFADPHGLCPTGACADVCKAGACGFKASGTACGAASCSAGVLTVASCDGATASCGAPASAPCPGHLTCASATTCNTSCVVDGDCTSGVCVGGSCVAPLPDAGPEASPDATPDAIPDAIVDDVADTAVAPDTTPEAAPDTAVDDVAVDSADALDAAEEGVADAPAPTLPPVPTIANVQLCNHDDDCPTKHCVEGVCCDTECKDRCHSCALLSNPGRCTLEPIGVDLKNECGPALSCLGTCGGQGECIGSGAGTQCGRNRCTGPSTGIGPAYCAAPGSACDTNDAVPFDCGAYACAPAFGACLTACTSTDDCAPGNTCDVDTKTCAAPTSPAPPSSSCALGVAPGANRGVSAAFAIAALALGAGLARRRRRD